MPFSVFKIVLFTLILVISSNCTVKYIHESPEFSSKIEKTKRILIFSDKASNIRNKESQLLSDITKDLVSHHKEFIVYPTPEKFSNKCGKENPKIEGLLSLLLNQKIVNEKIYITLKISLINCESGNIIWESEGQNSYSMEDKENESLRNTYNQKYGKEIEYAVNPYFLLTKNIIEKLESPNLSEDEKDEKIEIESL